MLDRLAGLSTVAKDQGQAVKVIPIGVVIVAPVDVGVSSHFTTFEQVCVHEGVASAVQRLVQS